MHDSTNNHIHPRAWFSARVRSSLWILQHILWMSARASSAQTPAANFRVTSLQSKVNLSVCPSPLSFTPCIHWFWLATVPPSPLQGYAGNDSPSDVFMSAAEPSVSLRCSGKVADMPPLSLMDEARLCIANLFYLLRQANPSGSSYNQLDPFWSSTWAPTPHLFINVR